MSEAAAAAGIMRAAILAGPGQVRIGEVARPEPGPGQVRVRLEGSGVCASNLTPWAGPEWMRFPTEPGALGHEGWGVVDALGDGVEGLSTGDRVAALSYNAYAEYDLAGAEAVVRLPESLAGQPFPGEPLGCAMNIFRRSAIEAGQTVAIVGVGFLGAILTRLAADAGARVIAVSRRPFSLDVARAMGAAETIRMEDHGGIVGQVKELTGGRFCDRVIEAVGKQRPLDLAAELTRERGRLIVAGYHQDGPRQVNMWLWNWRGLDVINAHERDPKVYVQGIREAVDAVASGRLDPGPLYTHVFPLNRLGRSPQRHARPAGRVSQSSGDILMTQIPVEAAPAASPARPRLGFLGVGWIGRHRMQAILETGAVEIAAIADPSPEMAAEAGRLAPNATLVPTLDDLLDAGVDGVVIATPSALHAEQSIRALERGAAVFCQKPLGRTAAETRAVVDAARAADRLLGVDLSYRFTAGMRRIREVVRSGALGRVYAADLVFHNAYGPDKPWFYDPALSGGGCVMDLGVHLVDLALWTLGFPGLPASPPSCSRAASRWGDASPRWRTTRSPPWSWRRGRRCGSPAPGAFRRGATP